MDSMKERTFGYGVVVAPSPFSWRLTFRRAGTWASLWLV